MKIDMRVAVAYMRMLKDKKITYSMSGSRTGADGTGDCSGTVYAALNRGGANFKTIGNTDAMFRDLPAIGFSKVTGAHKFGDIFVWGVPGASSGTAGHTGIFLDATTIINCNYGNNGVSIDKYDTIRGYAGNPPQTFFRNGDQGTGGGSGVAEIDISTKENMDNSGEIEEYSYIKDRLCLKGWHFASKEVYKTDDKDDSSTGDVIAGKVNWDSMQDRAQFFVSVCTELGYPKNTTLALLANANTESAIDPSALEAAGQSSGGAQGHGYLQWSFPSNWGNVPSHMKRTYEDARYQLKWAKDNRSQWINVGRGTFDQFWEGNQSPKALTDAWVASWERPAVIGDRWTQLNNAIKVDKLKFVKFKHEKAYKVEQDTTKVKFDLEAGEVPGDADKAKEVLEIFDATNDKLLKSVRIELLSRPDLVKKHSNVDGIEWSGFDVCLKFEHNNPFYVRFKRVLPGGAVKWLDSSTFFYPHSSARTEIGHDYCNEDAIAIITTDAKGKNNVVTELLSGISFTQEANNVPSGSFQIPITEVEKFDGNMDIKFIIREKMFDGIVKKIELDKDNETATVSIDHKIAEWEFRQIPQNTTVKNRVFPDVFSTSPFLYSTDWYVDYDGVAQKEKINYAFSRQNHLEALTKAVELTSKLFWRVGTRYDRYLEVGQFGEKKPYIVAEQMTNMQPHHIPIIGGISIQRDFDNIFNTVTVYGEKSDSSQASLTLREAYLDQKRKGKPLIDGFPIVVLNPTVNNEQKKYYTDIAKIASNNTLEYAVIDEFGINLEQGKIVEKTASFNDVAPFEKDNEPISDEERAHQSKIAYEAAVRRLKYSGRRREVIQVTVGCLPCDLNVLDQVYFDYSNQLQLFDKCSRYCKKIYETSGYFYIERIQKSYENNFMETNTITLVKELREYADSY